jgi:hypothetical protein
MTNNTKNKLGKGLFWTLLVYAGIAISQAIIAVLLNKYGEFRNIPTLEEQTISKHKRMRIELARITHKEIPHNFEITSYMEQAIYDHSDAQCNLKRVYGEIEKAV